MLRLRFPQFAVSVFAFAPVTWGASDGLGHGRQLFEIHCASCHGLRGEGGKGPSLAQSTLPRARNEEALRRIISSGIAGTEMPPARLEPAQVSLVAVFVKSLGELPPEAVAGNTERGARLYRTKGACGQCHSLNGYGGAIGPDLTEIGLRRSAAYLRRALIEPGADVPRSYSASGNFLFLRVLTRDAQTVAGVRVNEDTFSIQLRDLAGTVHSFFKAELVEVNKDWGWSPMPSYSQVFAADEMDDVVAFLNSLGRETR